MPSRVPTSIDGWWSDYKSEIGFLGFSYAVDQCKSMSIGESRNHAPSEFDRLAVPPQAKALTPFRVNSRISEPSLTADTSASMAHATRMGFSA